MAEPSLGKEVGALRYVDDSDTRRERGWGEGGRLSRYRNERGIADSRDGERAIKAEAAGALAAPTTSTPLELLVRMKAIVVVATSSSSPSIVHFSSSFSKLFPVHTRLTDRCRPFPFLIFTPP